MKLSNNSSFVILIFAILKFWNIDRFTFRPSKFWPPPRRCSNIRRRSSTRRGSSSRRHSGTRRYWSTRNFRVLDRKKLKLLDQTRPNPKKCSTRTPLIFVNFFIRAKRSWSPTLTHSWYVVRDLRSMGSKHEGLLRYVHFGTAAAGAPT